MPAHSLYIYLFFFNDTATTEIYTLSLHDALPIYALIRARSRHRTCLSRVIRLDHIDVVTLLSKADNTADRKSTRLNSSHQIISYAVFCLKKKIKIHANILS